MPAEQGLPREMLAGEGCWPKGPSVPCRPCLGQQLRRAGTGVATARQAGAAWQACAAHARLQADRWRTRSRRRFRAVLPVGCLLLTAKCTGPSASTAGGQGGPARRRRDHQGAPAAMAIGSSLTAAQAHQSSGCWVTGWPRHTAWQSQPSRMRKLQCLAHIGAVQPAKRDSGNPRRAWGGRGRGGAAHDRRPKEEQLRKSPLKPPQGRPHKQAAHLQCGAPGSPRRSSTPPPRCAPAGSARPASRSCGTPARQGRSGEGVQPGNVLRPGQTRPHLLLGASHAAAQATTYDGKRPAAGGGFDPTCCWKSDTTGCADSWCRAQARPAKARSRPAW